MCEYCAAPIPFTFILSTPADQFSQKWPKKKQMQDLLINMIHRTYSHILGA